MHEIFFSTANACNGATPHAYLDWLTKTNEKEMNHELDYPYENTNPGLTCQDVNIFHGGARVGPLDPGKCHGARCHMEWLFDFLLLLF